MLNDVMSGILAECRTRERYRRLVVLGVFVVLIGSVLVLTGSVAGAVAATDGDETVGSNAGNATELDLLDSEPTEITTCREITVGGVYTLSEDLAPTEEDDLALDPDEWDDNACIAVNASGVVLDGQGHTIDGSAVQEDDDYTGIVAENLSPQAGYNEASELTGVVVRDVTTDEWYRGVQLHVTRDATVTNVTGTGEDVVHDRAIHLSHSRQATVERNHVDGTTYGIYLVNSDHVTVENNTLVETNFQAIRTSGDYTTIRHNEILDYGGGSESVGVRLSGGDHATVEENYFSGGGTGIDTEHSADDPVIQNNTLEGGGTAILIGEGTHGDITTDEGSERAVVRGNEIDDFNSGIQVYRQSNDAAVRDNDLTEITNPGITVSGLSENAIVENNAVTDAGAALRLESDGAEVVDNSFVDTDDGIDLDTTDGSTIHHNDVSGGSAGLTVYGSNVDTVVANNSFVDGYDGVRLGDAAGVSGLTIEHNEISDNTANGIEYDDLGTPVTDVGPEILDNEITDNGEKGILDEFGVNVTYEGNYVADNGEAGIHLVGNAAESTIRGNTVVGNGHDIWGGTAGILLGDNFGNAPEDVTIEDNYLADNDDRGIHVLDGSGVAVANNDIVDNADGVVVAVEVDDLEIIENRFNSTSGLAVEYDVGDPDSPLNATHNWWGDESGPSGGVEDPDTGTIADGNGDEVGETVRFEPWLTSAPDDEPDDDEPAPDLSVVDASLSETDVLEGDEVTITADVENAGDASGGYTAALEIDGTVVANETVSVDAGETEAVEFMHTFDTAGNYDLTVDGVAAGTVTVGESTGGLFIQVADEDTGDGVEDVAVEIWDGDSLVEDGSTGYGGATLLPSVPVGTYEVEFSASGYESKTTEAVEIEPGEDTNLNVDLTTLPELSVVGAEVSADDVEEGDTVTITATVENAGGASGELVTPLEIDGTPVANETVDVPANATEEAEFTHAFADAGDYDVTVDGVEAGTVSVSEPSSSPTPEISVVDATLDATEVTQGDSVTVTADVENAGDEPGELAVALEIDGTVVDTQNVSVDAGETEAVPFTWQFDEVAEFGVTVEGVEAGTVTVVDAPPVVSIEAVDATTTVGDTVYAGDEVDVALTVTNQSALEAVTLTARSLNATYAVEAEATHLTGSEWEGTVDLEDVVDDGHYELVASATTEFGTENTTTAGETLVVDREGPSLSAALSDVDGDDATLEIRSDTPLSAAPDVTVEHPDGAIEEPAGLTDVDGDDSRWTVEIEFDASGEYAVAVDGTDRAGNDGAAETAVRIDTEFTIEDGQGVFHNAETDTFVEFRADENVTIEDLFVAIAENAEAYEELDADQLGAGFLTAQLDDDLSATLANATIHVPVDISAVDGIDDPSAVDLKRFNESADEWEAMNTTVADVEHDGLGASGSYWVADVEQFSTYGAIATDDEPPQIVSATPEDGETLDEGTDDVTISFEYADSQSGVNVSSVELLVDGVDVSDDENTAITSSVAEHTVALEDGQSVDASVTVADEAGNAATDAISFEVDEASSGGGGGGIPAPPTDPEPQISVIDASLDRTAVAVGESADLTATLENAGDGDGAHELTATVDDEPVAVEDVSVAAGETETVSMLIEFSDAGTVEVALDGESVETVAVEEPESDDPSEPDEETDAADDADDGIPGFGLVVSLLALILATLAAGALVRFDDE